MPTMTNENLNCTLKILELNELLMGGGTGHVFEVSLIYINLKC